MLWSICNTSVTSREAYILDIYQEVVNKEPTLHKARVDLWFGKLMGKGGSNYEFSTNFQPAINDSNSQIDGKRRPNTVRHCACTPSSVCISLACQLIILFKATTHYSPVWGDWAVLSNWMRIAVRTERTVDKSRGTINFDPWRTHSDAFLLLLRWSGWTPIASRNMPPIGGAKKSVHWDSTVSTKQMLTHYRKRLDRAERK